ADFLYWEPPARRPAMSASVATAADTGRARASTPAGPPAGSHADAAAFDRAVMEAKAPAGQPASAEPPASDAPDPARQQQIDAWTAEDSDRSGGFLGFGGTSSTEKVVGALKGDSSLGALDRPEQAYLVDRMLDRWASGEGDGPMGAHDLTRALDEAP